MLYLLLERMLLHDPRRDLYGAAPPSPPLCPAYTGGRVPRDCSCTRYSHLWWATPKQNPLCPGLTHVHVATVGYEDMWWRREAADPLSAVSPRIPRQLTVTRQVRRRRSKTLSLIVPLAGPLSSMRSISLYHIGKTGGTSVMTWLSSVRDEHQRNVMVYRYFQSVCFLTLPHHADLFYTKRNENGTLVKPVRGDCNHRKVVANKSTIFIGAASSVDLRAPLHACSMQTPCS